MRQVGQHSQQLPMLASLHHLTPCLLHVTVPYRGPPALLLHARPALPLPAAVLKRFQAHLRSGSKLELLSLRELEDVDEATARLLYNSGEAAVRRFALRTAAVLLLLFRAAAAALLAAGGGSTMSG